MKIVDVRPQLILNSQAQKTVQCTVVLDNGRKGTFAPPAGTSTGKYEATTVPAELAHEQILKLKNELLNISSLSQTELDEFLLKKKELGANTTLAVSIAFAIAADSLGLNSLEIERRSKTPGLMVLFFEGGVHAVSKVRIQEFMVVYKETKNIFLAADEFRNLRRQLIEKGYFVNVGMEGAMVSAQLADEEILRMLKDKQLALDIGGHYLRNTQGVDIYQLPEVANIFSIEDPYPEDDIKNWKKFFKRWRQKILVVGDDLTVTNAERIKRFANNAINAVIIKPNQQQTLKNTLDAIKTAKTEGLKIVISHRSGETNQTFIADLAVAVRADYVKFGAPLRGERVAKYNRLLELCS